MSFISGLKKALGIPDNDGIDTIEDDDFLYGAKRRTPYINPFKKDSNGSNIQAEGGENEDVFGTPATPDAQEQSTGDDEVEALPDGLFDQLIAEINSNLSPMLKSCIDINAEKKYIYDNMAPAFKAFVTSTREKALAAAHARWDTERASLKETIDTASARLKNAEGKAEELKEQQLSFERQKRTLTDKIRDLEAHVMSAEAEKEQLDLENKSLLNKVKVSQVKCDEADEALQQIEYQKGVIADLQLQLDKASATPSEELQQKVAEAQALLDQKNADAAKNAELLDRDKAEIETLRAQLTEKDALIAKTQTELDEANSNLQVAAEIQAQLDKVEDFKRRKLAEIAELNARIADADKEKEIAVAAITEKLTRSQMREDDLLQKVNNLTANLEERRHQRGDKETALSDRISALEAQLQTAAESIEQKNRVIAAKEAETKAALNKAENATQAKAVADQRLNEASTTLAEKSHQYEAEIASLQAQLQVHGKMDNSLVEPDLRQAVEETFDIDLDEPNPLDTHTADEPTHAENLDLDDIDDIDWLIPTPPSEAPAEPEKEPEPAKPDNDAQMSLF